MSSTRLYDKVMTIVGTLMIFFYLGVAYIILFADLFKMDKSLKVIMSIPFLLYGFYRIFQSYQKIRKHFFELEED